MAFYLGRLGSNPGTDLYGFFQFRIAVNLFSMGFGLVLKTCKRKVHTLLSSFLFRMIIYHCTLTMYKSRKRKNPKEAGKGP